MSDRAVDASTDPSWLRKQLGDEKMVRIRGDGIDITTTMPVSVSEVDPKGDDMRDEKAALEWLEFMACYKGIDGENARALKRMLAEPRLDRDPAPAALDAIYGAIGNSTKPCPLAIDIYRALYEHLTKPATKTVEVWHVQYVLSGSSCAVNVCRSREEADHMAEMMGRGHYQCIRVTGPHQQEVPTT